jgi:hypothetical protein
MDNLLRQVLFVACIYWSVCLARIYAKLYVLYDFVERNIAANTGDS